MDDFVFFYPEGHSAHFEKGHPERPERVEVIREALQTAGFWQAYPHLAPLALSQPVYQSVHQAEYLSLLQRACERGGHLDADTYVRPASWNLALNAAGGAAAVAGAVWRREARSGLALCRPPGHHAMRGQGMGFCLLNNVALAAENLIRAEGARRLAIVDIDLHHGNGTQDIFWARKDVFFISTHQVPLYPYTGGLEDLSAQAGAMYTMNVPMLAHSGDQAYTAAFDELVLPALEVYQPEMILVSYGFDAHWADPLGSLQLSAAGYAHVIQKLADFARQRCSGRIAVVLEGGYDLEAAQACTTAIVAALLDKPWTDPLGPSPYPETEDWKPVIRAARKLWGL